MKVRVFKNLHKHCMSVIAREGEFKGKVVAYAHQVFLKDCKYLVSEKSRQRVIREKSKNVHAFVEGELLDIELIETRYPVDLNCPSWVGGHDVIATRKVRYNPYIRGEFFDSDSEETVLNSAFALVGSYGVMTEPVGAVQTSDPVSFGLFDDSVEEDLNTHDDDMLV